MKKRQDKKKKKKKKKNPQSARMQDDHTSHRLKQGWVAIKNWNVRIEVVRKWVFSAEGFTKPETITWQGGIRDIWSTQGVDDICNMVVSSGISPEND